jgi:hypothetical protein
MPEEKRLAGMISAQFSETEIVERIIEGEKRVRKYPNEIEGFRTYHSAREYARRLREKLRN